MEVDQNHGSPGDNPLSDHMEYVRQAIWRRVEPPHGVGRINANEQPRLSPHDGNMGEIDQIAVRVPEMRFDRDPSRVKQGLRCDKAPGGEMAPAVTPQLSIGPNERPTPSSGIRPHRNHRDGDRPRDCGWRAESRHTGSASRSSLPQVGR
jgi:hypothetical protein